MMDSADDTRTTVKMMAANGLTEERIAAALRIDPTRVRELLAERPRHDDELSPEAE